MKTRTKIYLRNKRSIKKGLLVFTTPTHIPVAAMEELRNKLNAFMNDSDRTMTAICLPPDAKWQFINLK